MKTTEIDATSKALLDAHITGDITPAMWRKYLKLPHRRDGVETPEQVDHNAIIILAELVYWRTPTVIRNKKTDKIIGYKKKFAGDKIQKSYSSMAEYAQCTKRQAKEASDRLQDLGIISKEFRTIYVDRVPFNNVLFIELNAAAIDYISNVSPKEKLTYTMTKGLLRRGVWPPAPERGTNTETTTEINIVSKDTKQISKKLEKKPSLDPSKRTASALNKHHKPLIHKSQPQPHKISRLNQPYWDAMITAKMTVPKRPTAKIYKKIDYAITQLRLGKYYNDIDGYEHLSGRKISIEDFTRFCKHISLVLYSMDYFSNNKGIKDSLKRWYLDKFLYNNDSTQCKSLFSDLIDNPPKKVISHIQLKDPNPVYTDQIVRVFKEIYDMDLSNGSHNVAVRCTKRLIRFFDEYKDKIGFYDIHYRSPSQQVNTLLDAFQYHHIDPKPPYLYSDLTYEKLIPEFLEYTGSMK